MPQKTPHLQHFVKATLCTLQASDVYSFGVLLFEMLAGRRAWAGMNTFQITYTVLFLGQSLLVPEGLPPGLGSTLLRCLDADPANRCSFDDILLLLDVEAALLSAAPSNNDGPAVN